MAQRESTTPLDEYAVRAARGKVRQLVGRCGLTRSDRRDLEQELLLEVVRRLPRFDPARGHRENFVARVVEHSAIALLERRHAACRDWRRNGTSLQDHVPDEEGRPVELWRTLGHDACRERRGLGGDEASREDLRIDVATALATLPVELRETCAQLLRGTVHGTSRRTGVPRRTVRSRIDRIREHFERCGLGDYVGRPTPVSRTAPVGKQRGRRAAFHGRSA